MKTVLLLIPGMLNNARVWQRVMPHLGDQTDIRVADVCSASSIADMRDQAWAALADVPAHAPLVLAGFSMGGYVALDMLAHPARPVQALALISTSGRVETPETLVHREKTMSAIQADFDRTVQNLLKWNTHQDKPDQIEEVRQLMLDVGAQTALRQLRAVMGRSDHRQHMPHWSLPVSVLCGEHDQVLPPVHSQELAQAFPNSQLHLLPDCGHMLPIEQSATLALQLSSLMNSIQSST